MNQDERHRMGGGRLGIITRLYSAGAITRGVLLRNMHIETDARRESDETMCAAHHRQKRIERNETNRTDAPRRNRSSPANYLPYFEAISAALPPVRPTVCVINDCEAISAVYFMRALVIFDFRPLVATTASAAAAVAFFART